jgi:transposase
MEARMPTEFLEEVKPLLPPEKPVSSQGGRPPIGHEIVMKVIWFVLVTGCRWADVPLEMGCSGRTAHRRLRAWEESGIWDRLHLHLLTLLRKAGQLDLHTAVIDSVQVRAFGGGEETGPSPVDRGKPGSKHTLMVDGHGTPLAIRTVGANVSDQTQIIPIVLDFPHIGGQPGRPKEHPDTACGPRLRLRRRVRCCGGWESHPRSRNGTRSMEAAWERSVGSWNGRSVGSRDCAECACAMIG